MKRSEAEKEGICTLNDHRRYNTTNFSEAVNYEYDAKKGGQEVEATNENEKCEKEIREGT
jgi:hypothetical protein